MAVDLPQDSRGHSEWQFHLGVCSSSPWPAVSGWAVMRAPRTTSESASSRCAPSAASPRQHSRRRKRHGSPARVSHACIEHRRGLPGLSPKTFSNRRVWKRRASRSSVTRLEPQSPRSVEGTLRIARSRGICGVGLSLSHAPHLVAGVALPLRAAGPPTEANKPRGRPPVLGVGIDVLATKHIDDLLSYPRGSLERLFTAGELRSAGGLSRSNAVVRLSIVLAAKEASFKALGPLLRARRAGHPGSSTDLATDFRDIEIVGIDTPSPTGVPSGTLAVSVRRWRPRFPLGALPVVVAHDRELAGAVALCVSCPST